MFEYKTFQGEAGDFSTEPVSQESHPRETDILDIVEKAAADIVSAFGGHLSVSIKGHVNEFDDQAGDNLNLQVTSFLRSSGPAPDAGLESAGGSARNFPPEASTAAPATEDSSPPAAQDPIPQPDVEAPHPDFPSPSSAVPAPSDEPASHASGDAPEPGLTTAEVPAAQETSTPDPTADQASPSIAPVEGEPQKTPEEGQQPI